VKTSDWVDADVVDAEEVDAARQRQLATNLLALEERLAAACRAAGRPRREVALIAVTKTWPARDVRHLAVLGVRDVAENRDQEAAEKARSCADLDLVWHFVGQLQTNKARSVARYARVVHTVDRPRLVTALSRGATEHGRSVQALLQVRLDDDPSRGGIEPAKLGALADLVERAEGLELAGLMAIAPLGADAWQAFARLADVAADLRREHPQAGWLSAGMSGDMEAAVQHGATHLRIGTALLGSRPPLG
jgi:pyridoxal phosphate enzyme (YggS family)